MKKQLLLFVFLLGLSYSASAQLKIGYISPAEVINELPEAQVIDRKLQKFVEQKREIIVQEQIKLDSLFQAFQSLSPTLSEAQNKINTDSLSSMNARLMELQRTTQIEVQRAQSEMLEPLLTKVNQAIEAVAERQSLDFVFNKQTTNGEMIILFSDDENAGTDITKQVIAELNKN